MRSWTGRRSSLASVVMIVHEAAVSPRGSSHVCHSPAKANGSPDARVNRTGRLSAAVPLPLVEAVGRDQTAPPCQGGPEEPPFGDRLCPGVNERRAGGRAARTGGDQPPPHVRCPPRRSAPHGENRLGGRDVVSGRLSESRGVELEPQRELSHFSYEAVSPAHVRAPWSAFGLAGPRTCYAALPRPTRAGERISP